MIVECEDCRFWDEFYRDDTNLALGFCRRYAPRPVIGPDPQLGDRDVRWPITNFNDGCGEYEKAPMDIEP